MVARVLCVDAPWPFRDKLPGGGRGAEKHYKVMTLSDIIRMPLPPIAEDAVMFFWRVSSMVPEAYEVVRAWGFTAKSEIVWNKTDSKGQLSLGMGRIVRGSHETCIVATRGKGIVPLSKVEKTSFLAPRGRHSEKPEEFFRIVERLYPLEMWPEAHVELFARKRREGWISFGDELPPEAMESEEDVEEDVVEAVSSSSPASAASPPQPIELPTAWIGAAGNDSGEPLIARHRRARTASERAYERPVRANDFVDPPAPRKSGSWRAVIREVAAATPPPPENLGALVAKLAKHGVDIPLPDLCTLSPLHRSVALTFAEQGGDPPTFLEPYVRQAI